MIGRPKCLLLILSTLRSLSQRTTSGRHTYTTSVGPDGIILFYAVTLDTNQPTHIVQKVPKETIFTHGSLRRHIEIHQPSHRQYSILLNQGPQKLIHRHSFSKPDYHLSEPQLRGEPLAHASKSSTSEITGNFISHYSPTCH